MGEKFKLALGAWWDSAFEAVKRTADMADMSYLDCLRWAVAVSRKALRAGKRPTPAQIRAFVEAYSAAPAGPQSVTPTLSPAFEAQMAEVAQGIRAWQDATLTHRLDAQTGRKTGSRAYNVRFTLAVAVWFAVLVEAEHG